MLKQTDVRKLIFGGKLWEIPFPLIIQAPSVFSAISAHYSVTLLTFLILCLLNSLSYYPSCAVSRTRMRNLNYRLRYSGLTFLALPDASNPQHPHKMRRAFRRPPSVPLCCLSTSASRFCCPACCHISHRTNVHPHLG